MQTSADEKLNNLQDCSGNLVGFSGGIVPVVTCGRLHLWFARMVHIVGIRRTCGPAAMGRMKSAHAPLTSFNLSHNSLFSARVLVRCVAICPSSVNDTELVLFSHLQILLFWALFFKDVKRKRIIIGSTLSQVCIFTPLSLSLSLSL